MPVVLHDSPAEWDLPALFGTLRRASDHLCLGLVARVGHEYHRRVLVRAVQQAC